MRESNVLEITNKKLLLLIAIERKVAFFIPSGTVDGFKQNVIIKINLMKSYYYYN